MSGNDSVEDTFVDVGVSKEADVPVHS